MHTLAAIDHTPATMDSQILDLHAYVSIAEYTTHEQSSTLQITRFNALYVVPIPMCNTKSHSYVCMHVLILA